MPDSTSLARVHGGQTSDHTSHLDFSVNVCPYGPPPAVRRAIAETPVDRYPDPWATPARTALAETLGFEPERISVGAGAAELLFLCARLLLDPNRPALIVAPTFSEYAAAARAARADVHTFELSSDGDWQVDIDALSAAIQEHQPEVVFLCSPNNPTGIVPDYDRLKNCAEQHEEVTFILDESFLSLSDAYHLKDFAFPPSVVRLRSLTKDFAIPGVRAGFLIGSADLVAELNDLRPPWSVSAAAQSAIVASTNCLDAVDDYRFRMLADRDALVRRCQSRGWACHVGSAPFFLLAVANGETLKTRLLQRHRILIRSGASFGLPGFVRLASRPRHEHARLMAALEKELS